MMFPLSPTLAWIDRAAEDPLARSPDRLPESLDFREHSALFLNTYHGALPGVEIGFPLVLRDGRLHFPGELTFHARYSPFLDGGRFIGAFHVHPPVRPSSHAAPPAPFFDPADLASALRSDNAGFIDLLLTRDRLYALVRANPYLYISAHHVNRNLLLLQEQHAAMIHRRGAVNPADPDYPDHYRRAGLYFFNRYGLALYEGSPDEPLRRTATPRTAFG